MQKPEMSDRDIVRKCLRLGRWTILRMRHWNVLVLPGVAKRAKRRQAFRIECAARAYEREQRHLDACELAERDHMTCNPRLWGIGDDC